MAPPTKQAVEVARQFRKALALDLVTSAAPAAYEALKLTVQGALKGLSGNNATCDISATPYVINRQQLDAIKLVLAMTGVSEPARELEDKDVARLSLADLNKMIDQLKVVEHSAADASQPSEQPIDIFS